MEWALSFTLKGKDRMAELPLILVEQMFIFEEMTTVPYSLAKQQPGASCAQREEAALL